MTKHFFSVIALSFCTLALLSAQDDTPDMPTLIRKHAMEKSQVMEIASWITDVHGPRLTGSHDLDRATEWAVAQFQAWGMSNVHVEEWGPFGRSWELKHFELHAYNGEKYWPVLGYPKAWSPSASGTGEVIYINARTQEELDAYQGKLAGKFVLVDTIRKVNEWFDPLAERLEDSDLLDLANQAIPTPRPRRNFTRNPGRFNFNQAMWALIESEKPIAVIDRGYKGDYGTIFVSGARTSDGDVREAGKEVIPQITLSVEQYNRILRLLDKQVMTTLTLDMKAEYLPDDSTEFNIIAEIPGTDLPDEVVMFGAHFDSWHTGTGATDNGVGSAIMMEAARVLLEAIAESGIQPRRTLRIGLWTGEEQGILGSKAYVGEHFAEFEGRGWAPQALKPEQAKISAYYNLDNGTGKIRGIYTQGNPQVVQLFREWLDIFHDDGAATVTLGNTGGTDHLPFAGAGIPAFQFIQEPMAYGSRTHHSNMDVWDHLVEDDMKQAAMIVATFVWNTSQRDELLPRAAEENTMR